MSAMEMFTGRKKIDQISVCALDCERNESISESILMHVGHQHRRDELILHIAYLVSGNNARTY